MIVNPVTKRKIRDDGKTAKALLERYRKKEIMLPLKVVKQIQNGGGNDALQEKVQDLPPDLFLKVLNLVKANTSNPNVICMTKDSLNKWKNDVISYKPDERINAIKQTCGTMPIDVFVQLNTSYKSNIIRNLIDIDVNRTYQELLGKKPLFSIALHLVDESKIPQKSVAEIKASVLAMLHDPLDQEKIARIVDANMTFEAFSNACLNALCKKETYANAFVITQLYYLMFNKTESLLNKTITIGSMFDGSSLKDAVDNSLGALTNIQQTYQIHELIDLLLNLEYHLMLMIDI
jgi:hypothetical protein